MNCRTLVELVTDYLEGALGEEERAEVEAHLAQCDGCTAYLEQIRTTIRLTGHLHKEQIPPEAREPLRRIFREWDAGRSASDR
ncbi:MAG TPA: zf-HC2 domain-containing protein [Actinomycetota bacterium]